MGKTRYDVALGFGVVSWQGCLLSGTVVVLRLHLALPSLVEVKAVMREMVAVGRVVA